jgi:hypothetical protein
MAAMNEKQDPSALENAEAIIERFGGIRPMAAKMGIPVTTVQGWKKRNVIPGNRREDVIEAAGANNISLNDLLKAGSANQNTTTPTASAAPSSGAGATFGGSLSAAARGAQDPSVQARHGEAVAAAEKTAAQDEIIRRIKAAEKRAVKTSTWFTAIVVAGVAALGAVLLWPTHEQVQDNTRRVAALETGMQDVTREQGALRRLIPDNLEEKFSALQQQAQDIQSRINNVTSHAENMAGMLLDPASGPLADRIAVLEDQVNGLTGGAAPDIAALIDRVRNLQQTVEGQKQLASSVTDLNALVENMRGRMDHIDTALQQAQTEDDALGQTLAGVPPTDLRAAALLLGLAQFRSSLNRNAPFEEDLLLMKGLLGNDDPELIAAIDRLAPRAAEGVLTPEGLSDQFKGLAGDIVVSSLKGEDVSIQEKAKARLNDILSVQKDGELITGTDTQATVARAQIMLDNGDVEGAIAELQTLNGDAKTTAQPFIEDAMATLNAEQVKEMITGSVLGKLGSVSGGAAYTTGGGLKGMMEELEGMTSHVVGSPGSIEILPQGKKFTP